jgi:GNAT superfamily N-acetyltransferase
MSLTDAPREWYRDNYLISTAHSLLQPAVVNAALESESMYWTKPMSEEGLKRILNNSLCFGVYALPSSSAALAGKPHPLPTRILLNITGRQGPPQIGFARLITDHVTIAYLTDVFILEEHQKKGLGTWLVECISETLNGWPELKRLLLVGNEGSQQKFYQDKLGVVPFPQGKNGYVMLTKKGKGSVLQD